jgi:hypothetical protein
MMLEEPGVRFGLANGVLVVALLGTGAARLGPHETAWVAVLVAGATSVGLSMTVTTWMGVISWAYVTGFVQNRYGELTLTPPDLLRLLCFSLATLGVALLLPRLAGWLALRAVPRSAEH